MMSHGGATGDEPSIYGGDGGDVRDKPKAPIRIAVVAALGGFLFGYDSAVINGAVEAIREEFDVSAGPPASRWPQHCSALPPTPCRPTGSPTVMAGCSLELEDMTDR